MIFSRVLCDSISRYVGWSVGPLVRWSVSLSVCLAFFLIAEIGKSDKSKPENLTNLKESDLSLSAIQS